MNPKGYLFAALFAVAAVSGLSAPARADAVYNPQELKFTIPKDSRSQVDVLRKWSPPEVCRANQSATCVVCAAAGTSGVIVGVEVSSGAIGEYAVVLDTGAVPSAGSEAAASGAGQLLTQQRTCEYTLATTGLSGPNCGKSNFEDGVPFTNGATVCLRANAGATPGARAVVRFRSQRK